MPQNRGLFVKYYALYLGLFMAGALVFQASAEEPLYNREITKEAKEAIAKVVTPVKNPQTNPCYSVIDCRNKGHDLPTVWQVKNNTDYSPREYPDPNYVLGPDGKYVYSMSAAHNHYQKR